MPYGFKLTKDGNILALLHDVPQLEKNLKFLKGGKRLPGKYRDEYNQLFGNDTEVWEAFRQYRVNTANGMDGQLGLDNDPALAIRKKNFLNALHGAIDTEHINLNPILSEISKLKGMDMFNPSKRQPFGPATKTFRLDRIFDVTRSGNRNSNVNVDRAKKLLMPAEADVTVTEKLFMPASEAGAGKGKQAEAATFDAGERNILFMPSDSNYLKAVDQGDMQAAQQMVDQKAKENGYDVLAFHGTPEGGFDVFETSKQNVKGSNTVDPNTFLGSHFAEDSKVARKFVDDLYGAKEGKNPQLYKVYLKLEKPLGGDKGKGFNETKAQAEANKKARKKIADQLKQAHDQVDKINIKTDPSEFLKIMEQKGISEATAEISKQKKKKNPELFKRIERLNEKLEKIPNTSESIKIDLPGGEAFLSGDRALIDEGQFGLEALVKDNMGRDPKAESNVKYDMKRRKELGIKMRKALDKLGYDSVVYDNAVEGGIGIIVTDPSQIKSANPVTYDSKGNPIPLSKRFDSSKDSILYMPSDPKAPKAQPANRIQQQAPAMPGNRFMAPAASAGAKLSERFGK